MEDFIMKKNFRRFLAVLAIAALTLCSFAGSALAAGYVTATGSRVNVRTGPGENYTDLYTLIRGESVDYLGISDVDSQGVTWYKVQYYSYGTGWVCSTYASLTSYAGSGSTGSGSTAGYVRAENGNVNIRNIPKLTGSDLGTIPRGNTARYLGQISTDDRGVDWYYVNYNGIVGWVSSRYSGFTGGSSSSSGSSSSLPSFGVSSGYVMAEGGNVNVRSSASLNGRDLATIYEGNTATYLGQRSVDDRGVVWYYVNYNGTTGWVSSRYSTLVGSSSSSGSTSLPDFTPSAGSVEIVGGDCYIRTQPNRAGGQVGVMHEGDVGVYQGESQADERGVVWYKVKFNGKTGWVSSRYSTLY